MELVAGPELVQVYNKRKKNRDKWVKHKFSPKQVKTIMRDLLSAVSYIHSQGVIHRDIKLENILMTRTHDPLEVKLTDFGFASVLDENHMFKDSLGSPNYMAPELILKKEYNEKVDVWACGCVFYEIVCGDPLVSSNVSEDESKTYEFLFSSEYGARLRQFDERCRPCVDASDLLRALLHRAWRNRCSARFAEHHSFLKRRSWPTCEAGLASEERVVAVGLVQLSSQAAGLKATEGEQEVEGGEVMEGEGGDEEAEERGEDKVCEAEDHKDGEGDGEGAGDEGNDDEEGARGKR